MTECGDNGYDAACDLLGFPGRMISGTKRNPLGKENHNILWNACVFQATNKKGKDAFQIWHGDLDVTESEEKLQQLADTLKVPIFATPEQPFRFDGFKHSMKSYAADRVVRFDPKKGK